MKISGRLQSPEFENCSLPLTAMVRGKKVTIGRAWIGAGGLVEATIDDEEIGKAVLTGLNSQVSIKLNPEVRLEPKPADPRITVKSSVIDERTW